MAEDFVQFNGSVNDILNKNTDIIATLSQVGDDEKKVLSAIETKNQLERKPGQKNASNFSEVFNDIDTNQASGNYAHAEGSSTKANGKNSHAENRKTKATGPNSHAENYSTESAGDSSHAEGVQTIAKAKGSHAEGINTLSGVQSDTNEYEKYWGSHAEGYSTKALYAGAHAEGSFTIAGADVIEDYYTTSENPEDSPGGEPSDSDVPTVLPSTTYKDITTSYGAHSEGINTQAKGNGAHAEGQYTIAVGDQTHAEGFNTLAGLMTRSPIDASEVGNVAHAEGAGAIASSYASHAEGIQTKASGSASHSEGSATEASGSQSHAEGYGTLASGDNSHAGGQEAIANGQCSFVHGENIRVSGHNQVAFGHGGSGIMNIAESYIFSIIDQGKIAFAVKRNDNDGTYSLILNGTEISKK